MRVCVYICGGGGGVGVGVGAVDVLVCVRTAGSGADSFTVKLLGSTSVNGQLGEKGRRMYGMHIYVCVI